MKKIFSIFAALLFVGSMMADVVTFTFQTDTDITYTAKGVKGDGGQCEVSKSNVTLTSPSAYTDSGVTLSVYKGTTLTISAPGEITQIDLSYNGKVYPLDEALGTDAKDDKGKFSASGAHPATYIPTTPATSITLTNSNGGKSELLSLAVTYTAGETVDVTSVVLDQTSLALMVSETATLTATVFPDNATMKSVQWSTSDAEVATVNGGKVVAVGAGTPTITATSVADDAISATCTVTVTAKSAPEGAVFFETFDKFAGVGGNDGTWSNINTTPEVGTYDNEGWTAEGSLCAGYACVSIRKGKDENNTKIPSGLTTPTIGHAGIGKVMFNAESWGTDGSNFFVDIVGGGTFVADENLISDNISNEGTTAKVAMAKSGNWTTFTLSFKDFTATSKLRFYAPAGKRAFLDEVVVFVSATPAAIDNAAVETPAIKTIENGQLIIRRDGKKYNAMGVRLQ